MATRKGTKKRRRRPQKGQQVLFAKEWRGFDVEGVTNSELFASYYLQTRLKQEQEWSEPVVDARQRVKKLYDDCRDQVENWTEPQLRERLLQNVLSVLGFVLQPEVRIPDCPTKENVDWVFFAGETEREAAEARRGSLDYFADALALCEVKRWKVERFDRRGKRSDDRYVPARQIDEYLRFAEQVDWGILTNGRLWRLVHRDTSKKQRIYYQVDLPRLLDSNDDQAFRYFWLFFRKEAFGPDCLLVRALDSSRNYATKVGEDLENQVRPALEALCQGFFECRENGLDPAIQQHRIDARKEGLIFLYRLLFVLYAEDRDLLPRDDRRYRRHGLADLKKDAAEKVDNQAKFEAVEPDDCSVWERLRRLFECIDKGRKNLGIFEYNGGLFSREEHRFLAEKKVPSRWLYKVVDYLARTQLPDSSERGFVDFRDLQVQHLGTLYERLLTYRLREGKDKGLVVLRTEEEEREEGARARKRAGERKRTGSYYTPDYIVNYIVEQTLKPLLEEAGRRSETNDTPFEDEALKLNVLDPAMGSGHFLVRATERIAEEIATNPRTEDVAPEGEEAVRFWARRVVERCIYGVDLNDMAVELAKLVLWLATAAREKALTFLDHHLKCGNSLIGAKMEELGNLPFVAKVGRDGKKKLVPRLQTGPRQLSLAFMTQFRDHMRDVLHGAAGIINLPSDSREDIKKKEKLQKRIDKLLARYRAVADLWMSQHFGNNVTGAEYGEAVDNTSPAVCPKSKWEEFRQRPFMRSAENQRKNEKRCFFHWELEFPEVFFQPRKASGNGKHTVARADIRKDNPGFDAVIGNPPYIGFHGMKDQKPYLCGAYTSCSGKFDIYVAFLEQSVRLLTRGGLLCAICPSTFMKRHFAKQFRAFFCSHLTLQRLVDFGSRQIFREATNYTCIPLIANVAPPSGYRFEFAPDTTSRKRFGQPSRLLEPEGWIIADPRLLVPLDKIRDTSITLTLRETVESIAEGIVTGCNDVFILDEARIAQYKIEAKFLRRRLVGEHIHRFELAWRNDYVIYPYRDVDGQSRVVTKEELKKESPNLWAYLCKSRQRLSGRAYFERSAKRWYELWNQRSFALQGLHKIVVAEIEFQNKFSHADPAFFYGDTACGIVLHRTSEYTEGYLLALLNSKTLTFVMRSISVPKANGYLIYKPMYLARLPIRRIHFTTPPAERKKLLGGLKNLYAKGLHDNLVARVAELLPRDAAGNFLAFAPGATGKEEHSDAVHDLLAFLAQQMTRLHAARAKRRDGFFAWLRDVRYVDVTKFKTGRKRLAALWNFSPKAFFELFHKNRVRPDGNEYSAIRGELEKVLEKLSALQAKIESTDRLIDRIVYTLYGLTDEEVRIIEGGT